MEEFIFDSRYLNPLTDFGFHKIFGTESCKDLLVNFLNEIIREEGLITDIQYLISEQWGEHETERKAIFDIFCKNEKEEYFIVEMQKAKQPYFRERSIFYASLPIQKQAVRGSWNFRLKAVYLVAILDFVLFDEFEEDKEQIIESVYLVRERTKTLYSDKLNMVFVELPKFKKSERELETNADKWLFSLKNMSKLKERPASLKGKVFKELFRLAEIKQLTQEDMETYRKSILEYQDVRDAVDYARVEAFEKGIEEGRIEGREEGIIKGKILIIQRCFQKNIPIEDIVDLTGFSKEQIIRYTLDGTLE
jgi:predicted transposase/invertase (TIGR01784 family)